LIPHFPFFFSRLMVVIPLGRFSQLPPFLSKGQTSFFPASFSPAVAGDFPSRATKDSLLLTFPRALPSRNSFFLHTEHQSFFPPLRGISPIFRPLPRRGDLYSPPLWRRGSFTPFECILSQPRFFPPKIGDAAFFPLKLLPLFLCTGGANHASPWIRFLICTGRTFLLSPLISPLTNEG